MVEAVDDMEGELLDAVVAVHRRAFPDSALTILGADMTRRYYRSLWSGPHEAVGLVSRSEAGEVVGFLVGGTFRGSTIAFLSTQRRRLAGAVLRSPRALASPVVWGRVVAGLRLMWVRRDSSGPERPADVPPESFGVLSVAVDPAAQRSGIGGRLLAGAIDAARARWLRRHPPHSGPEVRRRCRSTSPSGSAGAQSPTGRGRAGCASTSRVRPRPEPAQGSERLDGRLVLLR